jgi:hypothetical protein
MAKSNNIKYPITIAGQKMVLQFVVSDAPTKQGIRLQFVMSKAPEDIREKDILKNKLSVVLQKLFGDAQISIDYDDRNPYENVIAYIVPMSSISNILVDILKGK